MRPKLSVMIITLNREKSLFRTLESLQKQTLRPFEIIIVDASQKSIEKKLLNNFKLLPIKYIHSLKKGYSVQRNIALDKASGDILATIDDDSQASPDWCERIIKSHSSSPQAVAIVGRSISYPQGSIIAITEQIILDKWFLRNIHKRQEIRFLSTKNASFKLDQ